MDRRTFLVSGAVVTVGVATGINATAAQAGTHGHPRNRVPRQAAGAGFHRLVFSDDFDSLRTIDLAGTGRPGKLWYRDLPWGLETMPASSFTQKRSVLTIDQGVENFNWGLSTASSITKRGTAFVHGYFEARIRFDPADALTTKGWPSFWLYDAAYSIYYDQPAMVPDRFGEIDIFEAWHAENDTYLNEFIGSIKEWHKDVGAYAPSNGWYDTTADWKQWHKVGMLWEKNHAAWYLDDQAIIDVTWNTTGQSTPPSSGPGEVPDGVLSILDNPRKGMVLILGTGTGFDMDVDWVRVWGGRNSKVINLRP